MGRIRTIKPEFFTSEDIVALDPMARLLYIAIWCEADKEGRLRWKPDTFKMRYLPADNIDIDSLCDALVTRGLVVLYGEGYAYIPSFKEHQHINPREKASSLPDPSIEKTTRDSRVDDASVTHREERKGKESNTTRQNASEGEPRFDARAELSERGVQPQTIADWLALRKAQKAPVTPTVLKDFIAQADKAGMALERVLAMCCSKGWRGFKAEWVKGEATDAKPAKKDWE